MKNILRNYDYQNNYLNKRNVDYPDITPAITCIYYSLDLNNSVIDQRDNLNVGTYRIVDNNLSGFRWRKILLLPLQFTQSVTRVFNADERSIVSELETFVVIPPTYNLTPQTHDFIWFNSSVTPTTLNRPLYQVTNYEFDNHGDTHFKRIKLNNAYQALTSLENQLSSTWMYIEQYKTIYESNQAQIILKLLNGLELSSEYLNTTEQFHLGSGLYVNE